MRDWKGVSGATAAATPFRAGLETITVALNDEERHGRHPD